MKAVLQSLEGLSDAIKAEYVERDGKFYAKIEEVDGWNLEDVQKLKGSLQLARKEGDDWKRKFKELHGAVGETPIEKVLKAVERIDEIEKWNPDEKLKEKLSNQKRDLEGKHKVDVDAIEKKLKETIAQLEKHVVRGAAIKAIVEQAGADTVELLLPHVVSRMKMFQNEKTGDYYEAVVSDDGEARVSLKSGVDGFMKADELLQELSKKESLAVVFKNTGKTGTGKTGGAAERQRQVAGVPQGQDLDKMTGSQLLKLAREQRAAAGA